MSILYAAFSAFFSGQLFFNSVLLQFLPSKVQGFTSALYSQQPVG